MPQPRFELYQPTTVEEALDYLAMHRTSVKVLSGGTGLLPLLRSGRLELLHLVSLGKVRGMRQISWADDDGLVIGANVRISEIARTPEVKEHYPALAQACAQLGTPQVRNQATLVGNVAWADPFSDGSAPLLAYDASLVVVERGARRQVHLSDFYLEPGRVALESFEMVEAIRVPAPPQRTGSTYLRLTPQSKSGRAAVGVACFITLDLSGNILKARLALSGAAPLPVRCPEAEQLLNGQRPEPQLLARAGAACVRAADPGEDVRASSNYRRLMVMTLAQKAIADCIEQVKEKNHE
jgi:carbon-monoxide dehydrogenase medium subunit